MLASLFAQQLMHVIIRACESLLVRCYRCRYNFPFNQTSGQYYCADDCTKMGQRYSSGADMCKWVHGRVGESVSRTHGCYSGSNEGTFTRGLAGGVLTATPRPCSMFELLMGTARPYPSAHIFSLFVLMLSYTHTHSLTHARPCSKMWNTSMFASRNMDSCYSMYFWGNHNPNRCVCAAMAACGCLLQPEQRGFGMRPLPLSTLFTPKPRHNFRFVVDCTHYNLIVLRVHTRSILTRRYAAMGGGSSGVAAPGITPSSIVIGVVVTAVASVMAVLSV